MRRPGLLFVMNDLRPGGAEMFVIRLAKYLQNDFDIHVYSCFPEMDDPDFEQQFRDEVSFIRFPNPPDTLSPWKEFLYWKLNAMAALFGIKGLYVKLKERNRKRHFRKQIREKNIQVINSSSSHSDGFAVNYLKKHFNIPAVVTMHSAYNKENWGDQTHHEKFFSTSRLILENASAILYTADANAVIFNRLEKYAGVTPKKVYLGYVPKKTALSRLEMAIPEDAFVVTMMARGIEEKGWQQALNAFDQLLLSRPNSYLFLIHTETEHIAYLRAKWAHDSRIRFEGYVADPSGILSNSDCTILPSHFPESLPYAITESLAYGIPVFATEIAEIPQMLNTPIGIAGELIPFAKDGVADSEALAQLLTRASLDSEYLNRMKQVAHQAFQRFTMDECGNQYELVFRELMNG